MVQFMEALLLADREALARYYGQGYHTAALPGNPNVEEVDKQTVLAKLDQATRHTMTKGVYHKTRHGFALLALIDPAKVVRVSPHAARLRDVLIQAASTQ